jgi:hypothetical protein
MLQCQFIHVYITVNAKVRLPHLFDEPLGGAWFSHVEPYLNMMVKAEPLRDVDDIMTSLILSRGTDCPDLKRHVPATLSENFVAPERDHSVDVRALIEKVKGVPIGQVSQMAKEIALTLLRSMGDIFPTYRRVDSVIAW